MQGDSVERRVTEVREDFLERYDNLIEGSGTLLVAIGLIFLADRFFRRRAAALARDITGGDLDPVVQTRLRFIRRLVFATITVLGVATALSQFDVLDRFAASVLASGAIAAAVVGFAAQQTLANVLAGVLLAVTQPIRIGDVVSFDEHAGVVEDIRLAHTYLQTGTDARVVVPNSKLMTTVLRNDSIASDTIAVEVELWLATEADELRALEAIAAEVEGARPSVKAVTFEGTTLAVAGPPAPPNERPAREAQLRQDCLRVLRAAGLR
jgi:small-conductance mechanosensitive channel